jgi:uncharacterized protein (TIGR04222 family)
MNPYDLTAGPFLALYMLLMAVCVQVALHIRRLEPRGPVAASRGAPTPLELAFLAGGAARLVDTATVALLDAGAARLDPKSKTLVVVASSRVLPRELAPFHPRLVGTHKISALGSLFDDLIETVHETLARRGLALAEPQASRLAGLSSLALWLLAAAGAARVYLGHERGHPVGYILALTAITGFAAVGMAAIPPRTRQAGREALRLWRERSTRLMRAPSDGEAVLAVALAGATVLSGTPHEAFAKLRAASASGGDGGSGCGDGAGGGGCGGCGGGGGH